MMAERRENKAIRVFVPAVSYRELFSEGDSAATDAVVKLNTKQVTEALLRMGLFKIGEKLLVSFVPVRGLNEDSPRPMKFIRAFKDGNGNVVDAFIEQLSFEMPLYNEN